MQRSPHGLGERSGDTHRIILLKARDGITYFWSKDAVNRAAIIAQSAQCGLHRTDIRRLHNQLFGSLEVVTPSPLVAWREISGVHVLPLVEQTQLISLSQWISRTKNIVDDSIFVPSRDGCAKAKD